MPYRSIARLGVLGAAERVQCGERDVVAVDLEEAAQGAAVVAATEAVGAERRVGSPGSTQGRICSATART